MEAQVTVIGAGVVGLAAARQLALSGKDVLVVEKEKSFGQGISSRNSEVIHAGIYYPHDSLKAGTCIEGRGLLYDYCRKNNIGYKQTGKLIVAINDGEAGDLESLFANARRSGVNDLELFDRAMIKKLEPAVESRAAIHSPSTGIIDSHGLMKNLAWEIRENRGQIAYDSEVSGIEKSGNGFQVRVRDGKGEELVFTTSLLVNAAGLDSDRIAAMAGITSDAYRLKYCKGDYFRVDSGSGMIRRLVYPVPKKNRAGLGIHATLDLAGSLRLGPDDQYVDKLDYNIDASKRESFFASVRQFLPFIKLESLSPDTSGIRPKLQGHGEPFRDFIIKEESDNGLSGLINLVGIESPGLTACLSIARHVEKLAGRCLA